MSKIELEKETFENSNWPFLEKCCFCYVATAFWVKINGEITNESLACCPICARKRTMEELPDKKKWFEESSRRKMIKNDTDYEQGIDIET